MNTLDSKVNNNHHQNIQIRNTQVSYSPKVTAAFQDEIRNEYFMVTKGQKRFVNRKEKLGGLSNQNNPNKLMSQALDLVTIDIKLQLEKAIEAIKTTRGPVPQWIEVYKNIDLDVLSLVGLSILMEAVGGRYTKNKTIARLGRAVEMEMFAVRLKAFDQKLAKRITDQVTMAHSSMRYRIKAAKAIAKKSGFDLTAWEPQKQVKVGAPLFNSIIRVTDIFEEWGELKNNKTSTYIGLTENASEKLDDMDFNTSWMSPMFGPMIVEPKPWTSFYTGCYLDDSVSAQVPLVKSATPKQRSLVSQAIEDGTLARKLDALNAIQATPYEINPYTHSAMLWAWRTNQDINSFPMASRLPKMDRPDNWDEMNAFERKGWTIDAREIFKKNREIDSSRIVMRQDLVTASNMSQWNRFYLPHNWDFRGRIYPVPAFSHHRVDSIKSLFYMNNKKPVGEAGFRWIALKVADNGDFDKVSKKSLDERLAWVDDNIEQILAVGKDYESTVDHWSKADKPFQYLAACREYYMVFCEGVGFESGLPIGLDGSNSGVQHYSGAALIEDAHVNLTVSDKPEDLYEVVADHVRASINRDDPSDPVVDAWQKNGVTRKIVKRNTMTYAYSSNLYGFRDQINKDFMGPINDAVVRKKLDANLFAITDADGKSDKGFMAAGYLAKKSWMAVNEIILGAAEGMDFFKQLCRACSKEGKAMMWVTPLGFPVVQRYAQSTQKKIKLFLYDREVEVKRRQQVSIRQYDTSVVDKAKSAAAVAPNIIHSQDSCHLHMAVLECLNTPDGIRDFFMIHDSFGCVPADADDMYHAVRKTFVSLYTEYDLYSSLKGQVEQQLDNPAKAKLPDLPVKGNLDISQVLESKYCFI